MSPVDTRSQQEQSRDQQQNDLANQRSQNQQQRGQREQGKKDEEKYQRDVDDLRKKVTLDTDQKSGASALLNGMLEKIDAAKNDPDKLSRTIAAFRENADGLAHAVVAGTPRDPGTDAPNQEQRRG